MLQDSKVQLLKNYFSEKQAVVLAFLFGSRSKAEQYQHLGSDWDIGVYFIPYEYMEIVTRENYPAETGMWADLVKICQSNDVDLVVLNRARPDLVFRVLSSGIPLTIKNRKLCLDLLSKTHYEAVDFRNFVFDFWQIRERSASLSVEDRQSLIDYLVFLEEEFKELKDFRRFTWDDYGNNSFKRKAIERWVENIAMSAIDIAKIILASDKKRIPQTYQELLKTFVAFYIQDWQEEKANIFSDFAKLRNIVVHEYLDMKWERIKVFIEQSEKLLPQFIGKVKAIVKINKETRYE